jgi:flavin-dependent dehydrogenase
MRQARNLPGYLDRFVEEYCPNIERVARFGALIPTVRDPAFYKLPCAGSNWILIGDAAGHVDPVLGEGIRYALWSAELASEAVAGGDPRSFDRLWREAYRRDFVEACRLRELVYDPKTLELVVMMLSRSETVARIAAGFLTGEQTYRGLKGAIVASLPKIALEARSTSA